MVLKKWDGVVDRIDLAQERDKCRAVVNTGFNKQRRISVLAEESLSSQGTPGS